jgi:N-hydroxyarylamine O-acetyltransferase
MAAVPAADRRYALRNDRLSIHHIGRRSEHRTLADASELMSVLRETFRLNIPDDADITAIASVAGVSA